MGFLIRFLPLVLVIVSATAPVRAQELPQALAERFTEGVAALKAGDLDTAERALRDVVARGGTRAFVHHNLGIVLQQRGRHADALAEFRTATKLDPAAGPTRLLAGTSLLALDRPKDAAAELRHAARLMPGDASVHAQLAAACERIEDVPCVAREARILNDLSPEDPERLFALGRAYLRLAQWSYERIRAIDPKSARLSQALGREMAEQGRIDDAIRAFAEAGERDPRLPGVHLTLAQLLASKERWDEAIAALDKELAISPGHPVALNLKARIQSARQGGPQ